MISFLLLTVPCHADITNGLVGWWKLNGGTSGSISDGTTAGFEDSSGSGNNGTAKNTNGTGMAWINGIRSGAVSFDGVDDYVVRTDISSLPTGTSARSMSCWFKFSSNTASEFYGIGNNDALRNSGIGNRLGFYYDGAGTLYAPEGQNISVSFSWSFDTAWHHLAISIPSGGDLAQALTYFDGQLASTSITPGTVDVDPAGEIAIGRLPTYSSGLYFSGLIDDIRIYNRVLSAEEILAIYNLPTKSNMGGMHLGGGHIGGL